MKKRLMIFPFCFILSQAFAQKEHSRVYKFSDKNIWVGKTYILPEPIWSVNNFFVKSIDQMKCFDSVVIFLKNNPNVIIELGVHTDSRPIPMTKDTLSYKRAFYVKQYLVEIGLNSNKIIPKGYGGKVPIILERDTTITTPTIYFRNCDAKTYFFKKNTVLDDDYINTIKDICLKELAYSLNCRPEMKIIKIE